MLLLTAAGTAALAAEAPVEYRVRSGDTLSELTRRYILPEHNWRDLVAVVRVRDPRQLPTGKVIAIPRAWLRWTPERATLASVRGNVTVEASGRRFAPTEGATLGEGARIATGGNSFTTLVFSNGSRIAMPSQSRVTVARLRRLTINGAIDYRFTLDRGRVDTRATPLKESSGRFHIETPLATTTIRGTEFDVSFNPERNKMGTGVFDGSVAVSGAGETAPLLVPEHYGAVTDNAGRSSKVELLEAPALNNPGRMQTDELVTFELAPVPGAVGYRIVVAPDAGFVARYLEQESALPHFSLQDVPNGNQFVRISALADNGLEGLRRSYAFVRKLASLHAEVAATSDGYRFAWLGAGDGERRYRLQIFRDKLESVPVIDEVGLARSDATIRKLPPGTYLWRVAVAQVDPDGEIENWTEPEELIVARPGGE